jgi:ribosome modulation factor
MTNIQTYTGSTRVSQSMLDGWAEAMQENRERGCVDFQSSRYNDDQTDRDWVTGWNGAVSMLHGPGYRGEQIAPEV